jgi:hypothetical protein
MIDAAQEWDEEERAEKIANALTGLGLSASAQDTGGGMICVVLERQDGGEISWGTADVTWGAAITDEDGEQIASIETQWPSDSQDIAGTAEALLGPSVKNGAVLAVA